MDASPIVVQFDPTRNVFRSLLSGRIDHEVDPLLLKGGEEGLGKRVVPTHPGPAEGMPKPEPVQAGAVLG